MRCRFLNLYLLNIIGHVRASLVTEGQVALETPVGLTDFILQLLKSVRFLRQMSDKSEQLIELGRAGWKARE